MIFRRKASNHHQATAAARVAFAPGTTVREGATATSVIPPSGGGDSGSSAEPLSYWIRLGAGVTGGLYGYTRIVLMPDGTWADTPQVGVVGGSGPTAPAHEVNDTVGLPFKRVRAFPTRLGLTSEFRLEFQAAQCEPGV